MNSVTWARKEELSGAFPMAEPAAIPVPRTVRRRPAHLAVNRLVRWGFYGFVFSIPFEYPPRSIPLEVHTITGLIFLVIAMMQPRICFRKAPKAFWWYAVYIFIYLALTLFFSNHLNEAMVFLFNIVQAAFLFWVGYNLLRYEAIVRGALLSFAISSATVASLMVLGIGTTVYRSTSESDRYTVLGQDPNTVGANMALGIITLLGLSFGLGAIKHRSSLIGKLRFYLMIGSLTAVQGLCLVMTGSRGGMAALGVGFLAFTLKHGNILKMLRNFIVVLSALSFAGWILINTEPMKSRYNKSVKRGDMSGRQFIFPHAIAMIEEKPFLGWGPSNQQYELYERIKHLEFGNPARLKTRKSKATHNLVLEVLASTGIIGAIPLFMCIGLCLWGGWKARATTQGILPFALAMAVLMVNMTVPWQPAKQGWLIFAYALAYGYGSNSKKKEWRRPLASPLPHQPVLSTATSRNPSRVTLKQFPKQPF
jgi:O-antigen ligase